MKNATFELKKAIYTRLTSGTPIGWKVYDDVPVGASLPYVEIGEAIATDWSQKGQPGQSILITFHLWSDIHSQKEADMMADGVTQSLTVTNSKTPSAITITGFNNIYSEQDSYRSIKDPDGETRHGILDIRFLVQEA